MEADKAQREFELRVAGFDTPQAGAGRAEYEDAGSAAWQRAQQLALQRNASQRRN